MPEKWLYLLRHAKSSWDEDRLSDHERPLAPRGRQACELIAAYMQEHQIAPALVLCSTSRRTRETLDALELAGEIRIERELYEAGPGTVLERLHAVPESIASVLVIGHNPALQGLALRLGARHGPTPEDSTRAELERKLPTGSLVCLRFEGAWHSLEAGGAELVALVRPKALHNGARP